MKNVLKIDNFSFLQIVFGLFFCLILLPSILKPITIGILGILIITYSILKKNKFNTKLFLLNGSLYIAILITLLYSENLKYGYSALQTMSPLFFFPLIFSFLSSKDVVEIYKKLKIYFWIYIIAVNLFNIIPFFWYLITQDTLEEIIRHYPKVILIDYGKYTIHPIYISMHTCIAILFSIYLFRGTKIRIRKFILIILISALVLFLLIYLRKGPVIAFMLALVVWSFLEFKRHLKNNLILILILISLIAIIPKNRNRFLELMNIETVTSQTLNSTNIRYTVFNNSIELIKESLLLGYGIGDYNKRLNEKNTKFLLDKTYNSHNQFLSFTLIGGVSLFLLFIFLYYKNFTLSLANSNVLLILILTFYGVMMFFENILERENGVIFIAFFINFFALKNYYKKDEKN